MSTWVSVRNVNIKTEPYGCLLHRECLFGCLHTHTCMQVSVRAQACRCLFYYTIHPIHPIRLFFFFKQILSWPAIHHACQTCLYFTPKGWNFTHIQPHPASLHEFWASNSGPHVCIASPLWAGCASSPVPSFSFQWSLWPLSGSVLHNRKMLPFNILQVRVKSCLCLCFSCGLAE